MLKTPEDYSFLPVRNYSGTLTELGSLNTMGKTGWQGRAAALITKRCNCSNDRARAVIRAQSPAERRYSGG